MSEEMKIPPILAQIAIELAREQKKVNYGNVVAKVINVGGVPTSVIFANTQKIRFHGADNKDVITKLVDVVSGLPKNGKSEANFGVSADGGIVKELTVETMRSAQIAKEFDDEKESAKTKS